jgi:PIN like domain
VKYFVDNNLPPALARAMHALGESYGHETWHLRQRFAQTTLDSAWISALSSEGGWSVITHDKLNKGLEREALRKAGLIVFFLDKGWANHDYWGKACNLVRWWPRIIAQSEGISGGAAFRVPFNFSGKGRFEQVVL